MTRRSAAARGDDASPPASAPAGDGTDLAAALDWRDRAHWGGRLVPCRYCHRGAFCRDDDGRPAHEVCAELALTSTATENTTTRWELSA